MGTQQKDTETNSEEAPLAKLRSVQALGCVRLCDPMDCSMPGLPVLQQLLEFAQTHVHQVRDAIQLSYPLLSPSPPAFNLSQHEGFFKESILRISGQTIGVSALASVLPRNIQD